MGLALAGLGAAGACSSSQPDFAGVDAGPEASDADDARRAVPDAEDVTYLPGDAAGGAVPAPYAGRTKPLGLGGSAALAGKQTFAIRCALCHGAAGKGNGPEGPKEPPPTDLTATRRDDAYLFWRISLGGRGAPFCSGMPAYSAVFSEEQIWQLVSFAQSIAPPPDGGADAGTD